MAYLEDLSDYTYAGSVFGRPGTKAVGWLAAGHDFPTETPSEKTLDLLWLFCSVSVALTRGGHDCEFCPSGTAYFAERCGKRLLMGTAEIRVFSNDGAVYAAPTLIYHYVSVHFYRPPEAFLEALYNGPRPPDLDYFERLRALGLEWRPTGTGEGRRRPFEVAS